MSEMILRRAIDIGLITSKQLIVNVARLFQLAFMQQVLNRLD
jgi:hypothetical protein